MALQSLDADPSGFPLRSGLLGASGAVVRGADESDACGIVVDEGGSVCVFVVKRTGAATPTGFSAAISAAIGVAARARLPLYELVADVRRVVVSSPGTSVGLSLLRFSARDARVEILNAGMPALVRLLPGAAPALYPSRSGPLASGFSEVHPYELSPLVWGSAWLVTSDGVTGGSLDPLVLLGGLAASGLEARAFELAEADPAQVALEASALADASGGSAAVDRSLVIVSADPRRRVESGIDSRR